MLEPIIQLLIPPILGRPQILFLLRKRPRIPNLGPRSVLQNVIDLGQEKENEVPYDDAEQNLVSAPVVRGVACAEAREGFRSARCDPAVSKEATHQFDRRWRPQGRTLGRTCCKLN